MADTKDSRNERQAAQVIQLTPRTDLHRAFPVGPGWVATRDGNGEVGIVRDARTTRKPPRMSRALSAIVAAIWLGSIGLVLTAAYHFAPSVIRFFAAFAPKF